jgi:hypothetical protein
VSLLSRYVLVILILSDVAILISILSNTNSSILYLISHHNKEREKNYGIDTEFLEFSYQT